MKSLKKCTIFLVKQICSNCNKWVFRYFLFFNFFLDSFPFDGINWRTIGNGHCVCGVKLDRKHAYAPVHCCL